MKKISYPLVCTSQFCGNLSCDGCSKKPELDAYDKAWLAARTNGHADNYGDPVVIKIYPAAWL